MLVVSPRQWMVPVICIFLLLISQFLSTFLSPKAQGSQCQKMSDDAQFDQSSHITPKLADNCHHVFLDVGSNIGMHNQFLFEPHLHPKAIFQRNSGGNPDNRDICAFAFEPNPAHKPRPANLSQACPAMGWRLHIVNAGVSDTNGTSPFCHVDKGGKNYKFGFTAVPNPNEPGRAEVVPVIRLACFIRQHVQGRKLPATVHHGGS
jgi:hypothetical protein